MDPRAAVAVILALAVLIFLGSGSMVRFFFNPDIAYPPVEVVKSYESVINVIIGMLAGYVMGREK